MKWARDMKLSEIKTELAILNKRIDKFEALPDDERCGGGSPGESLYERHEELTLALKKRA